MTTISRFLLRSLIFISLPPLLFVVIFSLPPKLIPQPLQLAFLKYTDSEQYPFAEKYPYLKVMRIRMMNQLNAEVGEYKLGLLTDKPNTVVVMSKIKKDIKISPHDLTDVTDAPYFSKKGNKIGIKVMFNVDFPEDTHKYIYPSTHLGADFKAWLLGNRKAAVSFSHLSAINSFGRMDMHVIEKTVTPTPVTLGDGGDIYNTGLYRFEFVLVPKMVNKSEKTGKLCFIESTGDEWIQASDQPFQFQLEINDAPYGQYPKTKLTTARLAPSQIYQAVAKEGLPKCSREEVAKLK
jgi:hypothetical protein